MSELDSLVPIGFTAEAENWTLKGIVRPARGGMYFLSTTRVGALQSPPRVDCVLVLGGDRRRLNRYF